MLMDGGVMECGFAHCETIYLKSQGGAEDRGRPERVPRLRPTSGFKMPSPKAPKCKHQSVIDKPREQNQNALVVSLPPLIAPLDSPQFNLAIHRQNQQSGSCGPLVVWRAR